LPAEDGNDVPRGEYLESRAPALDDVEHRTARPLP